MLPRAAATSLCAWNTEMRQRLLDRVEPLCLYSAVIKEGTYDMKIEPRFLRLYIEDLYDSMSVLQVVLLLCLQDTVNTHNL